MVYYFGVFLPPPLRERRRHWVHYSAWRFCGGESHALLEAIHMNRYELVGSRNDLHPLQKGMHVFALGIQYYHGSELISALGLHFNLHLVDH